MRGPLRAFSFSCVSVDYGWNWLLKPCWLLPGGLGWSYIPLQGQCPSMNVCFMPALGKNAHTFATSLKSMHTRQSPLKAIHCLHFFFFLGLGDRGIIKPETRQILALLYMVNSNSALFSRAGAMLTRETQNCHGIANTDCTPLCSASFLYSAPPWEYPGIYKLNLFPRSCRKYELRHTVTLTKPPEMFSHRGQGSAQTESNQLNSSPQVTLLSLL